MAITRRSRFLTAGKRGQRRVNSRFTLVAGWSDTAVHAYGISCAVRMFSARHGAATAVAGAPPNKQHSRHPSRAVWLTASDDSGSCGDGLLASGARRPQKRLIRLSQNHRILRDRREAVFSFVQFSLCNFALMALVDIDDLTGRMSAYATGISADGENYDPISRYAAVKTWNERLIS